MAFRLALAATLAILLAACSTGPKVEPLPGPVLGARDVDSVVAQSIAQGDQRYLRIMRGWFSMVPGLGSAPECRPPDNATRLVFAAGDVAGDDERFRDYTRVHDFATRYNRALALRINPACAGT